MGALLGFEDLLDGGGGEGVGAEAVDGFGGKGYGAAGAQEFGRARDVGGVRGAEAFGGAGGGHWCAV